MDTESEGRLKGGRSSGGPIDILNKRALKEGEKERTQIDGLEQRLAELWPKAAHCHGRQPASLRRSPSTRRNQENAGGTFERDSDFGAELLRGGDKMRRPPTTPSKPRRSRCSLPVLLLGVTVIFQICLAIAWARIKTSVSSSDGVCRAPIMAPIKSANKPPSTIALTLRVDQVVVHKLRPSPCVTMDWWPASKCDYGVCPWKNASVLTADLNDPLLVGAVKALSPVALRVGGSLADQIRYASIPHHSSEVSRKRATPPNHSSSTTASASASAAAAYRLPDGSSCSSFAR